MILHVLHGPSYYALKLNQFKSFPAFLLLLKLNFTLRSNAFDSYNAKEFCQGAMLQLYTEQGINHQSSCVETPQQNGRIERKDKHLLEVACALRFQSNLASTFWGESIQFVTYLINRMPWSSIGHISPYEKLYGIPPNNDHLHSFGCLCFVSTLKQDRGKFHARATPCVFVGYPYRLKGYKLYDIETKKIFVSRHVIFHEQYFPFPFHLTHVSPSPNFYFPTVTTHPIVYDEPLPAPCTAPPNAAPSSHSTPHPSIPFTSLPPSSPAPPPSTDQHDHRSSVPLTSLPPRTPGRLSKPSAYLSDYVYIVSSFPLPFSASFLSTSNTFFEPSTYKQAITDPQWVHAMTQELHALKQNQTWEFSSSTI